ncbi:MAG TPA: chemotaxis protein CheW [Aquabacterium sp.]|uniref:chemotaxis protein CheW n=1 Tax=Aquabacterium sp. TaxID=1872578 RepID=UPI002E3595CD|nr:chemotaxis protein CheW [Aquabacterium sp.]HEX5356469.1 chemotaxis protein CheW [Aquabacterium sp.]
MIITRSRKDSAKASRADAAAAEVMVYSGGIPYLTFSAGHTTYALYIASTTAIVDSPLIASDPRMPEFVKGALHLDGQVIPVIDLASRLGFPAARPGRRSCVVLVEAHLAEQVIHIGVEVDAVHEVLNLSEPGLEAPPICGANLNSHFVDVMAKRPGHYAMVMHVEQLLFSEELTELACLGELHDDLVHH